MAVHGHPTAIKSVAVIGAGVMGAGIAAHVANAGVKVHLLDVARSGETRSAIAIAAIEALQKANPAPLMSRGAARLITPGNIEDDLAALGDCDWIIEAVVERLDIKQALYRQLDAVRKPGSVLSSNTSTIPLHELIAGLPASIAQDFCITHFFNPPRYMRLLEVVGGPATNASVIDSVSHFADYALGKSVIRCHDTPGFIANRIGTYWIQSAMVLAAEMELTVEEADAIMGKALGFPSTGVFGLMDLVGLDLGKHVNASLARLLPADDPFHAVNRDAALIETLIAQGYTGNKGKGGFYRTTRGPDGKREKTALNLKAALGGTLAWQPAARPEFAEVKDARHDLKNLLGANSKAGRYAWGVLGRVLAYAASVAPEIADSIADIDEAMRLGYTWKYGPFELIDRLGPAWVAEHIAALNLPVPPLLRQIGTGSFYKIAGADILRFTPDGDYRKIPVPEGALLLDRIKRVSKPVLGSKNASVWDIGDGVLCFEIHAKMRGNLLNMLDGDIIGLMDKTIALTAKSYKALVFYNDDLNQPPHKTNFSIGANIGMAQFAANIRMWGQIEKIIRQGQSTYLALRYAPFPIVAAPAGRALGGGCELLLHCAAVQAYAESYIGLVETGVGLVPGWGGCATMLTRWQQDKQMPKGPMPAVAKVFETISTATVSRSAAEAQELKFLRPTDGITMNRTRLLADAKARAISMVDGYQAPEPVPLRLPGPSARIGLQMVVAGFHRRGIATDHDVIVADQLAMVLSGDTADYLDIVQETDVMDLERQAFMTLIRTKESLARIKSIVDTGKPLRN